MARRSLQTKQPWPRADQERVFRVRAKDDNTIRSEQGPVAGTMDHVRSHLTSWRRKDDHAFSDWPTVPHLIPSGGSQALTTDRSEISAAGLSSKRGLTNHRPLQKVKYLNNIIEQDHRFIKKITRPMKGFQAFHSAAATLQGIEVVHMIRKNQIGHNGLSPFQQSASLAG